MKLSLIAASALAAAALCSGCVSRTYVSEMGAAPAAGVATVPTQPVTGTLCNDGTMLPPNSRCTLHGGINVSNTTGVVPAPR